MFEDVCGCLRILVDSLPSVNQFPPDSWRLRRILDATDDS